MARDGVVAEALVCCRLARVPGGWRIPGRAGCDSSQHAHGQAARVGGVLARSGRADKAAPCFAKAWTQASGGAGKESGNVFVWGLVERVRVGGQDGCDLCAYLRFLMGVIPSRPANTRPANTRHRKGDRLGAACGHSLVAIPDTHCACRVERWESACDSGHQRRSLRVAGGQAWGLQLQHRWHSH